MTDSNVRDIKANSEKETAASAGNPAEADHDTSSADELKELIAQIEIQVLGLAKSFGRLAKAETALALYYAKESVRLFFARGIILLHIWLFGIAAWVMLMFAIGRVVFTTTGMSEAVALVLFAIHGLAVVLMMAVFKRLKL